MIEQWLPVVGYEGVYEVSSMGRVRRSGRAAGARVGRILKPYQEPDGRLQVTLVSGGVERKHRVHTLVLKAFVGPCPEGLEGCHNDGDPANNRVENLRWDTSASNSADMVRHGRNNVAKDRCPRGHKYGGANLLIIPSRPGARYCRACNNERASAWRDGREFSAGNADATYRRYMSVEEAG